MQFVVNFTTRRTLRPWMGWLQNHSKALYVNLKIGLRWQFHSLLIWQRRTDFSRLPHETPVSGPFPNYTEEELVSLCHSQEWRGLRVVLCTERGYGVVPTCDVPTQRVVCDYPGQTVDLARGLEIVGASEVASHYAVELPPPEAAMILAHDLKGLPSFGPLLNHSGRHPNCEIHRRYVSTGVRNQTSTGRWARNAEKKPIIVLQTIKPVAAGEELTWHYGNKYEKSDWFEKCLCIKCLECRRFRKLNPENDRCLKYGLYRILPGRIGSW